MESLLFLWLFLRNSQDHVILLQEDLACRELLQLHFSVNQD